MPTEKDDSLLLDCIVRGDPSGLSDLYDRYKKLVFSIAFHILRNTEDAEEVTLDVFSQVWEKAESYTAKKASVRVWLASIARYRSIDLLRRRNTRFTAESPKWADACIDCMSAPDDPETDLEMATAHKTVADAMAQLPQNQRDALSLAYFRGLSHAQIAETLAEPLGTVKTRIRSALQTLRKIMQEER